MGTVGLLSVPSSWYRVWLDDIEVPRVPPVPELPRRPSTEDLQPEVGVDQNGDPPDSGHGGYLHSPSPNTGVPRFPLEFRQCGAVVPGAYVSPLNFSYCGDEPPDFALWSIIPPSKSMVQAIPVSKHGVDRPWVGSFPHTKVPQGSELPLGRTRHVAVHPVGSNREHEVGSAKHPRVPARDTLGPRCMRRDPSSEVWVSTCVDVAITRFLALFPLLRHPVVSPAESRRTVAGGVAAVSWPSHSCYQPFRQPLASYCVSSLWKSRYWLLVALPLLLL